MKKRFELVKVGHCWQIRDTQNHNRAVSFFGDTPDEEESANQVLAEMNETFEIKNQIRVLERELSVN